MKTAIIRVIKYFIYLILLFCVIYGAMLLFGVSEVNPEDLGMLFETSRGRMLALAVVGLAVLYPIYGVTKKSITRVGTADIILAMEQNGFKLINKSDKKMVFIPVSFMRRLRYRFDDAVEIDNSGNFTVVKGARSVVFSIIFKLGGTLV